MNDDEFKAAISDTMDVILITSEVDFESPELDFEEAKELIINDSLPLIRNMLDDPELSDQDKQIGVMAMVGVVILENFYLNHTLLTLKKKGK